MADDSDIGAELQATFYDATMRFAQDRLTRAEDWAAVQAIDRQRDSDLHALTEAYAQDYDDRVATARAALLDEAAQQRPAHPAPRGLSGQGESIDQRARRAVAAAHQADLARTREQAQEAILDLLAAAQERHDLRGRAQDSFNLARDRRSGRDRRSPTRNQE